MGQVPAESHTSKTADSAPGSGGLEVRYEFTPILPQILNHVRASLFVTTYQAGKLMVLGVSGNDLKISFHSFDQPMGLAVNDSQMALGTRRNIQGYVGNRNVAAAVPPANSHDLCYVPRNSTYTGNIHGHELAWGHEGLWVVNTLFSCLCQLHEDFCFVPRWKPPFITDLADQDRCHLNGLAMDDGRPRFMTAMAETNTAGGWRPTKATSGVILDIASSSVVCRGLCMPHSPRVHMGKLWVLDSGHGALCTVDLQSGTVEQVERFPGYVRGLSFAGQFAFVGLSRIRETSVFGGVPIAEHREHLKCGIGVVDLVTGRTVAVFQFLSGVTEIFAVEAVQRAVNPVIAGSNTANEGHDVWIVPPPGHVPATGEIQPWYARSAEPQQVKGTESAAQLIEEGNRQQLQHRPEEAIERYQRAVKVDPLCVPGWQNLGYLFTNEGYYDEGLLAFDRLCSLDPSPLNRLLAASAMPVIYQSQEQITTARQRQRTMIERLVLDGVTVDATANLLPTFFYSPYHGENNAQLMHLKKQTVRGRDYTREAGGERLPRQPAGDRLKIGFISAYLHDHTIGRLNLGRIEKLDRRRFHVSTYLSSSRQDSFTSRLERSCDQFFRLPGNFPAAAEMLSSQDLDVLFFTDVGMDALTSTLAQSRFAPVQATTWGHPETTGSPAMDYFVSSRLLESLNPQQNYTETLVAMDRLGIHYENPRAEVNSARMKSQFGIPDHAHWYACPQSLFKFHPDFDQILEGILKADPQGILVLINGKSPEWTRRLKARWQANLSTVMDRIHFLPPLPHPDYLRLLELSDVVLDPVHFGGGNSSYESLAVGTPVITLPGRFLRSRITYGLYQTIEMKNLIVNSPEEFVQLATQIGRNRDLRATLSSEILSRCGVLFENESEVTCFADTIEKLAQQ